MFQQHHIQGELARILCVTLLGLLLVCRAPVAQASTTDRPGIPDNAPLQTAAPSAQKTVATPSPTGATTEEESLTAAELFSMGTSLAQQKKYDMARVAFSRALERDPRNVRTLNNLGIVLRRLGRTEDALHAYTFAIEIDRYLALTYKHLGIVYEDLSQRKKAAEAYTTYTILAPEAADRDDIRSRADWLEGL